MNSAEYLTYATVCWIIMTDAVVILWALVEKGKLVLFCRPADSYLTFWYAERVDLRRVWGCFPGPCQGPKKQIPIIISIIQCSKW